MNFSVINIPNIEKRSYKVTLHKNIENCIFYYLLLILLSLISGIRLRKTLHTKIVSIMHYQGYQSHGYINNNNNKCYYKSMSNKKHEMIIYSN